MKKITLAKGNEPVKFLVSGIRHSANAKMVEITEKGVIVQDSDAEIIKSRLGSQVNIEDVSSKDIEKEAKAATAAAEKEAKEAEAKAAKGKEEKEKKATEEKAAKEKADAEAKAAAEKEASKAK